MNPNLVLVVIAALIVAGAVFYLKKKKPKTGASLPAQTPVVPVPPDTVWTPSTVADYQAQLPASTRAYLGTQGDKTPVEAVDMSGHALGAGGGQPKVNPFTAGVPQVFAFTILGGGNPEINVMGVPGKISTFKPIIDSIPGFRPKTISNNPGDQHKVRLQGLPPGTYEYHLAVSKDGRIGVQFTQ